MRWIPKETWPWTLPSNFATNPSPRLWSSTAPASTPWTRKAGASFTWPSREVRPAGQSFAFFPPVLTKFLSSEDEVSCHFLLKHGALPTAVLPDNGRSPLHLLAEWKTDEVGQVAEALLRQGGGPNAVAQDGSTPLHSSVRSDNLAVVDVLLSDPRTDCERQDHSGQVPLWYALEKRTDKFAVAEKLAAKCPASVSAVNGVTGDPLLYQAASRADMEDAADFLVSSGADVNALNRAGESALHAAARSGAARLVARLLKAGSNPSLQTPPPSSAQNGRRSDSNPFDDEDGHDPAVGLQSPLHLAVAQGHDEVVEAFVRFAEATDKVQLDSRDSAGQTPLCSALKFGRYSTARLLISSGRASPSAQSPKDGLDLLRYFLELGDERAGLFLLDNGADVQQSGPAESALVMCIRRNLPNALEALCRRGANMEEAGQPDQPCPLWMALETGNEDLASVLVRYGVDTDHWEDGPEPGIQWSLLHRALDASDEASACFLVRAGCDVNSPRRGPADDDRSSPLHLVKIHRRR